MGKLLYETESYIIRGGCFEVYKQFRNRHKEKVYGRALVIYFKKHGLQVEAEKRLPVHFEGEKVGEYIPDITVDGKILIELKCKPFISKEDQAQFWYYLKITNFRLGFLINFGSENGVGIVRRAYGE